MRVLVVVLVWVWTVWCGSVGVVVWGQEIARVGVEAPECQLISTELRCDYRDSSKQTVRMDGVGSGKQKISRVVISNARVVQVGAAACVNLTLSTVAQAQIQTNNNRQCKTGESCLGAQCQGNQQGAVEFEFTASNTALDRLPEWASRIYLHHSDVTSLFLKSDFKILSATNTDIKVLDIARPLSMGSMVSLASCSIHTLQKLHTGMGSKLELQQTTIDVLASHGLVLLGGRVDIIGSAAVTVMDDSLVLGPLADLHIKDFSGHLRIRVAESDEEERCDGDIYFWLFLASITIMATTLITVGLIKMYKKRERKKYIGESRNYVFHK